MGEEYLMEKKELVKKKLLSLGLYVAMAGVVAYLLIEYHPPMLSVGMNGPVEEKISLLNGQKTTVARLLKKPLVINFWASWCHTCMNEMPLLSKLARQYSSQVGFLGVAYMSDVQDVKSIKKQFGIDYDVGLGTQEFVVRWQAQVVPTTYIIDTKGTIIFAHIGAIDEDELVKILNQAIRL